MALNPVVETLDGMEQGLAALYVQGDDGKYRLDIEGGFKTFAEVEGLSSALGKERTAREKAERSLKDFKASFGGFDVEAGRKAMEQVANLTVAQKQAAERFESDVRSRLEPVQKERDAAQQRVAELESQIQAAAIDRALDGSKFLAEKVSRDPIHQQFVREHFRRNFGFEEGKIVARDSLGNVIYNQDGQPADIDAALKKLVEAHPSSSSLLAGSTASGSGSSPSRGGFPAGAKVMTRAQFDVLSPADKLAAVKGGTHIVD